MLGVRLKEIRERKGLTLKAFATALGTSPGFLSEVENGKKMPGFELIDSLKRIYDIDLNWLLSGEERIVVAEESPTYHKRDSVTEKINQHLAQMSDADKKAIEQIAATLAQSQKNLKKVG